MNWKSYILQIAAGAVVLAALVAVGWSGHLSPIDTYNLLLALIGLLGGVGLWVYASTAPTSDSIPHVALSLLVLGAIVALSLHGIFTGAQTEGILGLIILGSAVPIGAALGKKATLAAIAKLPHDTRTLVVTDGTAEDLPGSAIPPHFAAPETGGQP